MVYLLQVKKMLKKIFSKLFPIPVKENHNIIMGKNSNVNHFDITRSKNGKITIGKDCSIHCHISLETDDAVLEIGDNVFIGPSTRIVCTSKIVIESDVLISADCLIQDSDNHSINFDVRKKDNLDWKKKFHDWTTHPSKPISIRHGAWIGAKTIILKGVTIGEKSIIGAGSVVTKSTEKDTIYGGNPARFLKKII